MITIYELIEHLNQLLEVNRFTDYCPNGLQVEGKPYINRLITGVTASQALLDAAVTAKADAILVHHGYFWQGEDSTIVGIKKRRLLTLLNHDISLIAYHLPLDAHLQYGNNIQLANLLGIEVIATLALGNTPNLFFKGKLTDPCTGYEFAQRLQQQLLRSPLHIVGNNDLIKTIGWCTGAGQRYIEKAVVQNLDAYLTGEVSEPTVHVARENGVHFFAAGHHATERYGVQALGEYIAHTFGIEHQFIDIDNPV